MKEIIFGLISGIVSALGMGGGAILIMLLNIFTKMEEHLIQGVNLIFFIPTAIVAIYYDYKNKIIDNKIAILLIISGIIGAGIGSKISFLINDNNLKKYFGYFLLLITLLESYEFFRKYISNKKEHNNINKENERSK